MFLFYSYRQVIVPSFHPFRQPIAHFYQTIPELIPEEKISRSSQRIRCNNHATITRVFSCLYGSFMPDDLLHTRKMVEITGKDEKIVGETVHI